MRASPLLSEGYRIGLDWLGQFVQAIIESVGIIGVGIICFTLILKAITLPFDSYQRYKSRKTDAHHARHEGRSGQIAEAVRER